MIFYSEESNALSFCSTQALHYNSIHALCFNYIPTLCFTSIHALSPSSIHALYLSSITLIQFGRFLWIPPSSMHFIPAPFIHLGKSHVNEKTTISNFDLAFDTDKHYNFTFPWCWDIDNLTHTWAKGFQFPHCKGPVTVSLLFPHTCYFAHFFRHFV